MQENKMNDKIMDSNTMAFATKKKTEKPIKRIDPPTPNSAGQPSKPRRQSVTWFTLGLLAILLWIVINGSSTRGTPIDTWQQFMVLAKENKLESNSVIIMSDRIVADVKPNTKGFSERFGDKPAPVYVTIIPSEYKKYTEDLESASIPWRADVATSTFAQIAMTILPTLIILGILWFLLSRSMRNAGGGPGGMLGNFGRSKHRVSNKEMAHTTFADVAGIDEAKEEVSELVEFLKDPKRFQRLAKRKFLSSPFLEATLWKCSWVLAPAACAICSSKPKIIHHALFSWTKLTPWVAAVVVASQPAGTTSASKRSTRFWWKWTALTPMIR